MKAVIAHGSRPTKRTSCSGRFNIWLFLGFYCLLCTPLSFSQAAPAQPTTSANSSSPDKAAEMTSHDAAATFKVNVKLVLVRVVVRDDKGHAIGTLKKDDFELFDNRKPQVISHFSVEQPGTQVALEQKTQEEMPGETAPETKNPPGIGERYVAYLFDDVHLKFGDLAMSRNAAKRHLAKMQPTDRAAIFSTSGQTVLDFTDDHAKLEQTLNSLQPRPITGLASECPNISYYMADQIVNKNDPQVLAIATQDTIDCEFSGATVQNASQEANIQAQAQGIAYSTARQELSMGEHESRLSLNVLKDVVRRLSVVPGQRSVVIVSPGFLTPELDYEFLEVVDRSLRSEVIINTLDARGLYTIDPLGGDISKDASPDPLVAANKTQYASLEAQADDFILADLANATGGTFFHNNNDLDEGFNRTATAPEYYYLLAFTPQNLKLDGSFHNLSVKLKNQEHLNIQARRGYYAPNHASDPEEQAKREIEDAVFSNEEMHDLPVELHTQFFKTGDADAKLTVLAHVDVKHLQFRKEEGRNREDLTVVSALFNRNGNYVQGNEKVLEMRLKDETLENKLKSGVTLKTSFDVKPGSYLVRLVVRDAQGQLMAAENGAVEIP